MKFIPFPEKNIKNSLGNILQLQLLIIYHLNDLQKSGQYLFFVEGENIYILFFESITNLS